MRVEFSGLNLKTASVETFSLDLSNIYEKTEPCENLDNFYLTFDCIYHAKPNSGIFLFDFSRNKFDHIYSAEIVSLSSNTNYLFCLLRNNSRQLELIQLSQEKIVKKTQLAVKYERLEDLLISATDINVYLFENGANFGVRCLFELNEKNQQDKVKLENEVKLNESSTCSLNTNRVVLSQAVKKIVCGKEHLILLSRDDQRVYSFGLGTKAQLGHGKIENCFEVKLVESLKSRVVGISAGGWHSAAVDQQGRCFVWGWNSHAQLGLLDEKSAFVPTPSQLKIVNQFTNKESSIKRISLGARHSALVDSDNNLFTFGWNKYKQLFHEACFVEDNLVELQSDNSDFCVEEPLRVSEFDGRVVDVKCGSWFTLLLLNSA